MKYDLESLHWDEFERLVKFYLKDVVGEGVWTFDGSKDKGRDAAYHGSANSFPSRAAPWKGDWMFQAKHRTLRSSTLHQVEDKLIASLSVELNKIFKKYHFQCDNYVYITNLNVSNQFREEADKAFEEFCTENGFQSKRFHVIDYKDLDVFIARNPYVRHEFPSLLSYVDIGSAFLRKEDTKNKGYIISARKNIHTFVSTKQYVDCIQRVSGESLLILSGDQKSGKTSIIEAISLCFLEEGDYKPYFIRNTNEFFTIASYLDPSERAVFICDDIFGKHELDQGKLEDWTDYFESVMGIVSENYKFIFTTREYIFNEFVNKSGLRSLFPQENDPNRYVVKLKELAIEEREQILEKHVYASSLSESVKSLILSMREEILKCKDFSPEVIRSLVAILANESEERIVGLTRKHIAHPNKYLYDFFDSITLQKKMVLLALATSTNSSFPKIEEGFKRLLAEVGSQPSALFSTFINEIDGSIVKQREYLDTIDVEYYHPSMYDVMVSIFQDDSHYRSIMLRNINLELLYLITLQRPKRPHRIQMQSREIDELKIGIDRLLVNEEVLLNIINVIRWLNSIGKEAMVDAKFFKLLTEFKSVIRNRVEQAEFFNSHTDNTVDTWIALFDRWTLISGGMSNIQYVDKIEKRYRDYNTYDYWRLMFLIESIDNGVIERLVSKSIVSDFIKIMHDRVEGLRMGLNIEQGSGKPKTSQYWLPLFWEVDNLLSRMKKSRYGNKIIENHLLADWLKIKQYSTFAKNRHLGMIKSGYWKPFQRIGNYKFLRMR